MHTNPSLGKRVQPQRIRVCPGTKRNPLDQRPRRHEHHHRHPLNSDHQDKPGWCTSSARRERVRRPSPSTSFRAGSAGLGLPQPCPQQVRRKGSRQQALRFNVRRRPRAPNLRRPLQISAVTSEGCRGISIVIGGRSIGGWRVTGSKKIANGSHSSLCGRQHCDHKSKRHETCPVTPNLFQLVTQNRVYFRQLRPRHTRLRPRHPVRSVTDA